MGAEVLGAIYVLVAFVVSVWVAIDSKRRGYSSGRVVLHFFMVLIISVVGLILYIIIRPAGKMAECQNCRKKGLSQLKKCPHCGLPKKTHTPPTPAPVPQQPAGPLKIKCPHCGQIIEQQWKTCPYCGRKIILDKTIIDEVFLMYKDGRLIRHFTRRLKPDMDQDILSGMLTAVQGFIKDSFRGETGDLDHMKFGKFQILVGHGRFITIAAVTMGEELSPFKPQIVKAIDSMEKDYEAILRDWDGDVERLNVLGRYVMDLIDGRYA